MEVWEAEIMFFSKDKAIKFIPKLPTARNFIKSTLDSCLCRFRTGHGKHGKSWDLLFQFPGPGRNSWNLNEGHLMESHGKAICFQKIERQKDKKKK